MKKQNCKIKCPAGKTDKKQNGKLEQCRKNIHDIADEFPVSLMLKFTGNIVSEPRITSSGIFEAENCPTEQSKQYAAGMRIENQRDQG